MEESPCHFLSSDRRGRPLVRSEEFIFEYEPKKTSQYKGVYWHTKSGKWYAHLRLPTTTGQKKFGGAFNDEMDAAKRVNQLCEELGIPLRNPRITSKPTGQCQVTV